MTTEHPKGHALARGAAPTALAVLALAAWPALSATPSGALDAAALEGHWTCTGGKGDVAFESRWSLEPSGDYSDASRVETREDIDRDSRPNDLVIESTERGEWSVNADGKLQFHVTELELRGLEIDGEKVPLDRAKSMLETLTSAAVGRVLMVGVESDGEDRLRAVISGIESICTR